VTLDRGRRVHLGSGTLARIGIAAVVLGASLGTARVARAADRDAREQEAKRACLASHVDQGIEILADLYAETNDPTYIYNQARCFEQNGRAQDALNRFREYLRKTPNGATDERAQVQAQIAELEEQLHQGGGAAAPTPGPVPPPSSAPATPTGQAQGVAADGDGVRARRLRVAGIVTASIGAAAIGGAAFMGWRAQSLSDEVTNDAKKGVFSRSKDDEGRRAETLQWIGYGIGGAALVGGALLYYVGTSRRGEDGPSAVALLPALGPGTAGASVRLRF
jgi:hypothetical protein